MHANVAFPSFCTQSLAAERNYANCNAGAYGKSAANGRDRAATKPHERRRKKKSICQLSALSHHFCRRQDIIIIYGLISVWKRCTATAHGTFETIEAERMCFELLINRHTATWKVNADSNFCMCYVSECRWFDCSVDVRLLGNSKCLHKIRLFVRSRFGNRTDSWTNKSQFTITFHFSFWWNVCLPDRFTNCSHSLWKKEEELRETESIDHVLWLIIRVTVCRVRLAVDLFRSYIFAVAVQQNRIHTVMRLLIQLLRCSTGTHFSFLLSLSPYLTRPFRWKMWIDVMRSSFLLLMSILECISCTFSARRVKNRQTKNVKRSQPKLCQQNEWSGKFKYLKYLLIPFLVSWFSGKCV